MENNTSPYGSEIDPLLLSPTEFHFLQEIRKLESELKNYKETFQTVIEREKELSKPGRQIIAILNNARWMSVAEIAALIDLPIRRATYLIYRLEDEGFVHFSEDENKFEEALKSVFIRNTEKGMTHWLSEPASEP